ncbi:MAG: hypothetical protein F4W92_02785 [Gammaproteobacteria bacterium]|nr:hypothetical protein [Gammaproteobacteria bacterium]
MTSNIGILNESALHKSLKELQVDTGDEIECDVEGYIVDVKKADRIVEIQTSNLHRVARKIQDLVRNHFLHLVYPIAEQTTITKSLADGSVTRRKSPKRGTIYDIFGALVSAPTIISHPKFSLEVPMIHEEQIRVFDNSKAWRRRHWVIVERRLIEPINTHIFNDEKDLWSLFSDLLPETFTSKEVAHCVGIGRRLAQQSLYCLRRCGVVEMVGKKGNELIYQTTCQAKR